MPAFPFHIAPWVLSMALFANAKDLPEKALLLDLDAGVGLTLEDGDRVAAWENQAAGTKAREFVKRDEGRKVAGSGRPTLRKSVAELSGKPSLVFRQQELVCMDDDTFDALTTGQGHTWIAVIAMHEQRVGLKDVNSFFGNLRNGEKFEGVWGCTDDDNTLWWGGRNGLSFGRFDSNNPKISGPTLKAGAFHILIGRMEAGKETVKAELFVDDDSKPVATGEFPVNVEADPSRMAIGQERDAIEHPGKESFDGEIARFLIWNRPLDDKELEKAVAHLKKTYDL